MKHVEPQTSATDSSSAKPQSKPVFSRAQHLFWRLTYFVCAVVFVLLWGLRSRGRRNVPRNGPVLVVANHQSFFDPVIIGLSTVRPLAYLARKTLFRNRFFAWLIGALRAVPIDQEGVGKEGIRAVLQLLRAGHAVVIFPEGERTPHGDMQPLKPGIHLLLKRAQVPIVPVGIAGAYDAWPIWQALPKTAPLFLPANNRALAVSVGKPITPEAVSDMPRDQLLQFLFDKIHEQWLCAKSLRRTQ